MFFFFLSTTVRLETFQALLECHHFQRRMVYKRHIHSYIQAGAFMFKAQTGVYQSHSLTGSWPELTGVLTKKPKTPSL